MTGARRIVRDETVPPDIQVNHGPGQVTLTADQAAAIYDWASRSADNANGDRAFMLEGIAEALYPVVRERLYETVYETRRDTA